MSFLSYDDKKLEVTVKYAVYAWTEESLCIRRSEIKCVQWLCSNKERKKRRKANLDKT